MVSIIVDCYTTVPCVVLIDDFEHVFVVRLQNVMVVHCSVPVSFAQSGLLVEVDVRVDVGILNATL